MEPLVGVPRGVPWVRPLLRSHYRREVRGAVISKRVRTDSEAGSLSRAAELEEANDGVRQFDDGHVL